jgi:hypothetical protein
MCGDELVFDMPHPLEPINSYHYADLYYHSSGWLIAYPIEIFYRPSYVDFKKEQKETKKSVLLCRKRRKAKATQRTTKRIQKMTKQKDKDKDSYKKTMKEN